MSDTISGERVEINVLVTPEAFPNVVAKHFNDAGELVDTKYVESVGPEAASYFLMFMVSIAQGR